MRRGGRSRPKFRFPRWVSRDFVLNFRGGSNA
jgi:hypothetical protein